MKILFLSRWFPVPVNNGSKLRIFHLLRGLAQHHSLTLLSFADQPAVNADMHELRSLASNIHVVPWREFDPHSWRAKLGLLSITPRSITDTFSEDMAHRIRRTLIEEAPDLVIASQLPMAAYYPYFADVPALFEEIELGLSYESSGRDPAGTSHLRKALTRFKLHIYLSRLLRSFRAVTVVSERERELVSRHFPFIQNISVIPNCMNLPDYRDIQVAPQPNTLVFAGPFRYQSNYEAMCWFIREVFPLVLDKIPDAQLIITGDHANLPLPSYRNITLKGYVEDIRPLIASATIAIAPLRSGGGTRLKILEAMTVGTPVISTSKGAEGLDAQNGEHFFVADDPIEFCTCAVRLLRDEDLRKRIARNARLLVQEKYDWTKVLPDFVRLTESIVT